MTDKLRRTHPLNITIADGESPTGAKLTAIAAQARVGARVLEKAVGDLWNQSGDSILSDWPLQIPNLARMMGENKWLNPLLYPVEQQFSYRDNVGAKYPNQNHGYLQFKPASVASVSAVSGSTNLVTKVASEDLVDGAGDYWVDSTTGRFRSFSALGGTDKLDYTVDPSGWAITDSTVPGVIPDPRQTEFTGCRISTSGGGFLLHLPPRRPITLTGYNRPERYPSTSDIADNIATSISPYKLWQSSAVNALADSHYRYPFPEELADIIGELAEGVSIPEGFLYLWDQNKRTIVEDATFTKSDQGDWILQISAPSQDLNTKVGNDESQASYAASGYSLIVCGTPIARAIWSLNKAIYAGTHNNTGDFTPIISHSALSGLNPPNSTYSEHSSRYPTTVPVYAPSRWAMDDHVSLLSRSGSQGTAGGRNRDVNDNAMLGNLLIASTVAVGGNYLNITNDSHRIYFGSVATGPHIYLNSDVGSILSGSFNTGGVAIVFRGTDTFDGSYYGTGIVAIGGTGASGRDAGAGGYFQGGDANGGLGGAGLEVQGTGSGNGIDVEAGPDAGTGISASAGNGGIGIDVSASGAGGAAASAVGMSITSTGYGIVCEGDTTSPAKAAFRLVPQNAEPTGPNSVGDMYMTTAGVLKVCTVAGTPGTWISVGAQT